MKNLFLFAFVIFLSLAAFSVFLIGKKVIDDKGKSHLNLYFVSFLWLSFLFLIFFVILRGVSNILWFLVIMFFLAMNILSTWVISGKDERKQIENLISERDQLALDLQAKEEELTILKEKNLIH